MHIPDGFLDAKTCIATYAVTAAAMSYAVKKTKDALSDRQVPAMGMMAAFIFAAQMINFPVAGGTSGHLLGAALAAIVLGPWSAFLIISTILTIQALVFQDGGLTVLGANIFNMALLGSFTAHFIYKAITGVFTDKLGEKIGLLAGAWASVIVASGVAAVELALSGTIPLNLVLPAMLGWHAIIGIGEALITLVVVSFVTGTAADIFGNSEKVKI